VYLERMIYSLKLKGLNMRTLEQYQKASEKINYCPTTGEFTWKSIPIWSKRDNDYAGSINNKGYRVLCIDGSKLWGHHMAWVIIYGELPDMLDHINRDRSDNRIINLRKTNKSQNGLNSRSSNNKSGYHGVHYHKCTGKWVAQYKKEHLGLFNTPEEALVERLIRERIKFQRKINRSNNKSGFPGVGFVKTIIKKPWYASISINGKTKHIGYYATRDEAIMARIDAEMEKYYDN
jgi:hypothetical protein